MIQKQKYIHLNIFGLLVQNRVQLLYKQLTPMFIITNKRFTTLGNQIFEFMSGLYPNLTEVDIEVIPTDLTGITSLVGH